MSARSSRSSSSTASVLSWADVADRALAARRRPADAVGALARRRPRRSTSPRSATARPTRRRRSRATACATAASGTRRVTLALAWRPFQANPPTQFLAAPRRRERDRRAGVGRPRAAGQRRAAAAAAGRAERVRLEPLAAGPVGDWLREPAPRAATGRSGSSTRPASPAPRCRIACALAPGERARDRVALPVSGAPAVPTAGRLRRAPRRASRSALARPPRPRAHHAAAPRSRTIARTLRTALGHILVNRSGAGAAAGRARLCALVDPRRRADVVGAAAPRPGRRRARLPAAGIAPFQFANGKVPCCATERGADPVPENDSDGEFAFAAAELWQLHARRRHSRATLWPHVRRAIDHMEALRAERAHATRTWPPSARAYFGMMPPSISHEGYSDKPAYSYWDDFWACDRLPQRASSSRRRSGLPDDAAPHRARSATSSGATCSRRSPPARQRHGLDVLPGAADRGDFDPTSSTIALSPGGLLGTLPDRARAQHLRPLLARLRATRRDERQPPWDGATRRTSGATSAASCASAQRERALRGAGASSTRDRRPAGWNQWAEVVLRDAREPRFLGDMPHGWVASDQIRSVLDLFAYEHEGERSLVLAAGVPMAWFDGAGLTVQDLRTPYGRLGWSGRGSRSTGARSSRSTSRRCARSRPAASCCAGRGPGRRGSGSTASRLPARPTRSACRARRRRCASSSPSVRRRLQPTRTTFSMLVPPG